MGWVQDTPGITQQNVTTRNNVLVNLYFENLTIGLHVKNITCSIFF